MHIEPEALRTAVTRLREASPEHGIQEALTQICRSTAGVFGVDGAGMMMVDDAAVLRYVAASDDTGRALERAQEAAGEGPCVEALVLDHLVASPDVHADDRWPRLAAELDGRTPVRAVLGVPTHVGGAAVGSLDVYRTEPHDWDDSEIAALQAFNGTVEVLLGSALLADAREQVVEQLRHALEHRVMIERAVGVLMAQRRIDAVAAFNLLRDEARAKRQKVADLAARLLGEVSRER